MAGSREDGNWYLAEIVEEFTIEGQVENVVHINFVRIDALSPDDAYDKAVDIGQLAKEPHFNSEGRMVFPRFVGIRNLHYIYERLQHGAELLYERLERVDEATLQALIPPGNALNVFRD